MLGLGLSLTLADFKRVVVTPKAAVLALGVQMLALPMLCFGLVLAFQLPPVLAVGMMLLAAAPGGSSANIFSHLAGGDIALNITLTAINSVLASITLPMVVTISISYFMGSQADVLLPLNKLIQVVAIVLIPVAIGMGIRKRFASFADQMRRTVKIASLTILVAVIVLAMISAHKVLIENIASVGSVALLLCMLGLAVGYWLPRVFGVDRRQAIASTYEVGIQNSTLAIAIAVSVIGSAEMAVPAAIYGVLMYLPAFLTLYLFRHESVDSLEIARQT
jgi:BASS family bile acid:Na+ symporter